MRSGSNYAKINGVGGGPSHVTYPNSIDVMYVMQLQKTRKMLRRQSFSNFNFLNCFHQST